MNLLALPSNYWNLERKGYFKNEILFNISNEKDYYKAIIYYISGMTDQYAIRRYSDLFIPKPLAEKSNDEALIKKVKNGIY